MKVYCLLFLSVVIVLFSGCAQPKEPTGAFGLPESKPVQPVTPTPTGPPPTTYAPGSVTNPIEFEPDSGCEGKTRYSCKKADNSACNECSFSNGKCRCY